MEHIIKKRNSGITLIALVITIIVLLILAGVSIAMLTGDNGILTQATEAKEETRGGAVQEARDLWKTNQESDKLAGTSTAQTLDELLADLKKQKQLTDDEIETIKETGKITIGSRTIVFGTGGMTLVEMFKKAEAEGCSNANGRCGNKEHLHIGDYVNYTPVAGTKTEVTTAETGYTGVTEGEDTTQRYTVDTNTTWRVLGLSEDKNNLLLTSGSPIKKDGESPYLILQGATSYKKCVTTLEKISNIYKNEYAEEARSMTADDINNVLGITVDRTANKVYKNDNPNVNIDQFGVLGQTYTYREGDWTVNEEKLETGNPKIGTKEAGTAYYYENVNIDQFGVLGQTYTYREGDWTVNEEKLETGNPKIGTKEAGTAYYYEYGNPSIVDSNSRIYDVLFKGTTQNENYAKSYWLASPGVVVDSAYAYFGPGSVNDGYVCSGYDMFGSYGYWFASEFAVRPVVSLKSDITVNEIQKTEDKTEPTWNTEGGSEVNRGNLNNNQPR